MFHCLASPVRRPSQTSSQVVVLLLHPPERAAVACKLAIAWRSTVPAAEIFAVSVDENETDRLPRLASKLLNQKGLRGRPLVLVGICSAEAAALRLGFNQFLPRCVGVLLGGRVLPPFAPLAVEMADRTVRLRRLWEVSDPMAWAPALGELLSWFRTAGLDAQGMVIKREDRMPIGECTAEGSFSPALVYMGLIYLEELVAVAMDAKLWPKLSPATSLPRSIRIPIQPDLKGARQT